jgi:hypothetical protein
MFSVKVVWSGRTSAGSPAMFHVCSSTAVALPSFAQRGRTPLPLVTATSRTQRRSATKPTVLRPSLGYSGNYVSSSQPFYQNLPLIHRFADVVDERHYRPVPDDWDVVLTDVRGSTAAIEAGRYQDVNSLGAATIIAVRNALPDVELPFVFGGDGATLLTPSEHRAVVTGTLRGLDHLARSAFDLELRCGLVPVETLHRAGHALLLAKFRASPNVTLAMFMGSGLSIAEGWVKHPTDDHDGTIAAGTSLPPDLTGFECRWQPVKSHQGVTVALLVSALGDDQERQRTYGELLTHIDALTGSDQPVPIHPANLHLRGPLGDFSTEAKLRSNQRSGKYFERAQRQARTRVAVGQALSATGGTLGGFNARRYKQELLQNCDFRKFDDVLRMILDVSHATHTALHQMLERYRHEGRLCYGTHTSDAALITCYVRSYSGDHLHFVDGMDGGYALAAKELKAQLASSSRR